MNSEELKQKRISLNLTQQDLANAIGKSRKTINTYEQGASIPEAVQKLLTMYFDSVTKGNTLQFEKKEEKSDRFEDVVAQKVLKEFHPMLAEVFKSHDGIKKEVAKLILDNDDLQDDVEELKEETINLKKEIISLKKVILELHKLMT